MGRSKLKNPRNKVLSIALEKEELDILLLCKPKDMKLSVFCRLKLLGEIK